MKKEQEVLQTIVVIVVLLFKVVHNNFSHFIASKSETMEIIANKYKNEA